MLDKNLKENKSVASRITVGSINKVSLIDSWNTSVLHVFTLDMLEYMDNLSPLM